MNNWFEQWSKAGAGPNFRVQEADLYIQNFNWVENWFKIYFFTKISDLLLGLILLILIVVSIFYNKSIERVKFDKNNFFIYFFILILFFEWFYNHPALRYGGYCLLVAIIFIPFSFVLQKFRIA